MDSKYEFMKAFNPEENIIKEFNYWVVLVRVDQVTLGDCLIVLKSGKPTFGELDRDESAELQDVLGWYENKCRNLFGAVKFNYIAAMMRDNFAHFHAFPRYSNSIVRYGINWVDEMWPRVIQFTPHPTEKDILQRIKADLQT